MRAFASLPPRRVGVVAYASRTQPAPELPLVEHSTLELEDVAAARRIRGDPASAPVAERVLMTALHELLEPRGDSLRESARAPCAHALLEDR